jgi:predicted regulator of Ras-like GTPase activity (Roadblock/LC7/MglB family)
VDAAETLAQLSALSSEIERAAIVDAEGVVLAAIAAADGEKLARAAAELFDAAPPSAAAGVAYVEIDLPLGSVFAVRELGQVAVATTGPEPAAALVLHDLRALLQRTVAGAPDA